MKKISEKMKNFKISKKLMISYTVILTLLVLGILVSIFNLVSIGKKVETFYDGPFKVSASANIVNERFEGMQKSVYRAISNDDLDITNEAIKDAEDASALIQEHMPIIKERFSGDDNIVESLETALSELAPMREQVIEYAKNNKNSEAASYMEEHNIPKIAEAQEYLDVLIDTAEERGETLIEELNMAQMQSITILMILGIASVGISVAFALYITKSITQPISEIETAMGNLSQGILTADITYESEDELGNLSNRMEQSMETLAVMIRDVSFLLGEIAQGNFQVKTKAEDSYVGEFKPLLLSIRDMNASLSDTLKQINEGADQVAIGSTQMAENAQSLAEGATEQAGAVEELNAAIEGVANMANESAEETRHAVVQVDNSVEKAKKGTEEMEKLTLAMERINETSQEIGNIIAAIEDIASQTNLLSLNASIEAARAGEAGKGFAVVADQIGKLASDSAQSAVNTRELIEKTLQEIEVGNKITDNTSQAFAEVIEAMKEFAEIARETNEKSVEQSGSLMQIREGIEQIAEVVQSNSASAEEASATSEELAAQSDTLKSLVGGFRLK